MRPLAPSLALLIPTFAATPSVAAQASTPQEFIQNGGFETGTFESWDVTMLTNGDWTINDGTLNLLGLGTTANPQSGSFDATTTGTGPGVRVLQQCFTVPPIVNAATLSWTDEIRNLHTAFVDPTQEFRVELRDPTGAILAADIFSTNPGDVLVQPSTMRSFDITTELQALAGQQVCLTFVEEDNLFFFHLSLDDVSLIIDTPSVPSSFVSYGTGCGDPAAPLGLSPAMGSSPTIGGPFDVEIGNVPTSAISGTVLIGGLPQMLDLSVIGANGCTLLTTGIVSRPFPPTLPTTTVTLNFPANPSILGINGFLQAAMFAPGFNPIGVIASNGGQIVIGDI